MLYTSQCVYVPAVASGSSTIRTKLLVPDGTFSHDTAGDSLAPVQVYASDNTAPGTSASTRTEKNPVPAAGEFVVGVAAAGDGDWGADIGCGAVQPHSQRANTRQSNTDSPVLYFIIGIWASEGDKDDGIRTGCYKKRKGVLFLHQIDLNTANLVGKEIVEQGHYRSHDEGNNPKNDREKNN